MKPNIFVIVSEENKLIAYPVIVMFPKDENSRQIIFFPLIKFNQQNPRIIATVHRNNLSYFQDVHVRDLEIENTDANALVLSVHDLLVSQRYSYVARTEEENEALYLGFVEAFSNFVMDLLKDKPQQVVLISQIYNVVQRLVYQFDIESIEFYEFMSITNELLSRLSDSVTGVITVESVKEGTQNLIKELSKTQQIEQKDYDTSWMNSLSSDDNDFLRNLL